MFTRAIASGLLLACAAGLSTAAEPAAAAFYPPAPGHENAPVVVFGHYMPQIPLGHVHAHPHFQGNSDAWPFLVQGAKGNSLDEYVSQIRAALAAGVNGFQMLSFPDPKMFEAAAKVYEETGEIFYVAPDWSQAPGKLPDDPEQGAKILADFAEKYRDNRHSLHLNGRQIQFFYGEIPWAKTPENQKKAVEYLKKRGVNPILAPAIGCVEKFIMGMPPQKHGYHYPVAPFEPYRPQNDEWLRATLWDGASQLSDRALDNRYDALRAVRDQTAPFAPRFTYFPAVTMGYDSSNRLTQATHDKFYGIRRMHDSLKEAFELGYRIITLATWNDITETLMLPSSRSPYGYTETCRYLSDLARTGHSPFAEPHFIAAFNPEVLYGDEWFFQLLVLPQRDQLALDYKYTVRLEDLAGQEVVTLGGLARIRHEREDALVEARWDTTPVAGRVEVVSPVISVTAFDPVCGARREVFTSLRLPPVRLRYNKLHVLTPYTISLNMVAPEAELALSAPQGDGRSATVQTGELATLKLQAKSAEEWRRLSLAESQLPLGAFRADDTNDPAAGRERVFLRVQCLAGITADAAAKSSQNVAKDGHWGATSAQDIPGRLTVADGFINDAYSVWGSDLSQAFRPGGQSEMAIIYNSPSKPWIARMPWVYRLTAKRDSAITFSLNGQNEPLAVTSIGALLQKPVLCEFTREGQRYLLDVRLTTDLTDPNRDFVVPAAADLIRQVPIDPTPQTMRVFHAWGLTATGKVAWSAPVAVHRRPAANQPAVIADPQQRLPVRFIRTHGAFDDFRDATASGSVNPFTAADVVTAEVPAAEIPYYLFVLDEGLGDRANFNGTGNQLGYGLLSGDYAWVPGWRGTGVRLGKGGRLALRPKSGPHGCTTFSLRLYWEAGPNQDLAALYEDGDWWQNTNVGPMQLMITPAGRIVARSYMADGKRDLTSDQSLVPGWNHIVAVYDLTELRLYLNGRPAGRLTELNPAYQRTHSLPFIGFSRIRSAKQEPGVELQHTVDQIEVIGTALDDAAVSRLYEVGQWLAR